MKQWPLLLLCMLSSLFACPGRAFSGSLDTVATVGSSSVIRFIDLQGFVHDRFYDRMYRTKPLEYAFKKAVDDMVVEQLKRIDFFERGLQGDSSLLQTNRRLINEELVIRYFNQEYLRKYVNARVIQDAYEQMKREVVCRRFLVDTSAQGLKKTHSPFSAVAGNLESELARGATFDELVSACRRSLRISTAAVNTATVTWKDVINGGADSVIFNLPVGQVKILSSPTAIEIVRIMRVNALTVEPFDRVKDEIYNILRERLVDRPYEDFKRAKEALVDERDLHWNEGALQGLLRWSNIRGFYGAMYVDTLTRAIAAGRNPVLLKYRNGNVDLKEYLRLLNEVLILPEQGQFRPDDLKRFILEAVRTDKLVRKAKALGLEPGIFNAGTADPELRDRIVSLYNKRMIDSKIPELTEERIRDFYAANRDSLYYQLAKINIYAVIRTDRKEIDSLWLMHQRGTAFEKLSHEIEVKTFIRDRYGDTVRSYLSEETPFLGKAGFTLGLNQVAGPVEYYDPDRGTCYAIIKCVATRPEKQLTLVDARKTIAADFKEYYKNKLGSETVKRLEAKYGFRVYEDIMTRNVAAMQGK